MVSIENVPSMKYVTKQLKMPFNPVNMTEDYMAVLLIKDSTQSLSILSNKMLYRDIKYSRYYKPNIYKEKIFNHQINVRMTSSDAKNMANFTKVLKMLFLNKSNTIKNKNVVIDTSTFHENFINSVGSKMYLEIAKKYVELLAKFINTTCSGLKQSNKFIYMNTTNWDISADNRANMASASARMLNPLAMIYFLMKKNPEYLSPLDGFTFIILDGDHGYVKFDASNFNKEGAVSLFNVLGRFKVKNSLLENDGSDISSEKDIIVKDVTPPDKEEPEYSESDDIIEDDNEDGSPKKMFGEEEDNSVLDEEQLALAKAAIVNNHRAMSQSVANNKRNEELRRKQKEIKLNNIRLGDLDEEPNKEIDVTDISSKIFTPNEDIKKLRFDNFNESYMKNNYQKDVLKVFKHMSEQKNFPVYIRNVDVKDSSDAMNLKETWTITLEGEDRVRHTVSVDLPKVYDNNYLYLGGNKKQFVNQQILKPLVKIAPDVVQVCSNYNKIFTYRYGDDVAPYVVVFTKIIMNNPKLFTYKRGNGSKLNDGQKTSIEYDSLAKNFLEIGIRGKKTKLIFNQEFFKEDRAKSYNDNYLYCAQVEIPGKNGKKELQNIGIDLTRDASSNLAENQDEFNVEMGTSDGPIALFTTYYKHETGVDFWSLATAKEKAGKRFMYSRSKIMAKFIPLVILLSYYEGISTVLKKANIQHYFSDKRPKVGADKAVLQFSDGYLVYDRFPVENSILMNGFATVDTKGYKYSDFDDVGVYLDIFDAMYNSRILAAGLDSYYENMIDPITKEILTSLDLPTDFVELMLAANSLLADNNYTSDISLTEFRVRNMEMIVAYLYKTMADAYHRYKMTAMTKKPQKISVPRNEVIKQILTSSVVEDTSIINPISEKEKQRAITCKGPSGINLDGAYTQARRSYDKSMVGNIGIATSPDGNCGVVRKLTQEPKVINQRGFFVCNGNKDELDQNNIFSYAELLTPLGVTNDDGMRTSMAVKQSGHIIPVKDMSPVLISNGAEKMLPYTSSKDFVIRAKTSGRVKEINNSTKMMILAYDDGTHEAVNFNPIIGKNGGGGFYLSNTMKTDYKVGMKFKANDIIAANTTYYSKHYDGVKYNIGTLAKTALMSSFGTYEDSKTITADLSERLSTEMVMMKHVILGPNATVSKIVKTGDSIAVGEDLIVFEQSNKEEMVNQLLRNIGDELKEEIKSMGKNSLPSKYTGTIEEVRIYSTNPVKELSPSLGKIVSAYWKEVKAKKELIRKYGITDPTYQGNTFYELDEPITPDATGKVKGYKIEEGVIIEFYIKFYDRVGVGDKLCDFTALKGITAVVIPKGLESYTPRNPDESIDNILPASSVLARKVPSILNTLFGNKLIVEMKKQLREMYEKG